MSKSISRLYLDLNKAMENKGMNEKDKDMEKGKSGLGPQHRSSQKVAQQRAMWAFLSSIGHNRNLFIKKPTKIDVKKVKTVEDADVKTHNVGKALEDINMLMGKAAMLGSTENVVVVELMEKAMTARSIPSIPRAMRDDTWRSATAVMTRDHTRFAKDMHTGPLADDMIEELRENEAERTHRLPIYKSCSGCGRTYMAKSENAECPSCSVNKSMYCKTCGSHVVKSQGGISCPLCC